MTAIFETCYLAKDAKTRGAEPFSYLRVLAPSATAVALLFWGAAKRPSTASQIVWEELLPVPTGGGEGARSPAGAWHALFDRLDGFVQLKEGWNGYTAPAPQALAIETARELLVALQREDLMPTRLAPSAMGGVAVTRRQGGRKAFVECYNDGRVYALFSERPARMHVEPVPADRPSFERLVRAMREYLNG